MSPAGEIVQIVDRDNREIAAVSRRLMRSQGLIHRASYILVFNKNKELFIQRRTLTKDIYPGYWDVAAGGVVQAGENYDDSARRELFEELGIRVNPLIHCFDHYYEDENNRVWGRIYCCTHEGPFVLQKDEVEYGMFVPVRTALSMSRREPFTPDGVEILLRLEDTKNSGQIVP
jgi:8-oxo-dGTP pyrophosphatase MutT (NUDIX family)